MSYEKLVLVKKEKENKIGFCGAFKATMKAFADDRGQLSKEPSTPLLAVLCSIGAGIGTWLSERSSASKREELVFLSTSQPDNN